MSPKPSVVTKAVFGVFPSMSELVATVVPWTRWEMAPGSTAPSSSARATAAMKPMEGSAGVDGTLAVAMRPVSSQIRTASVKVPPTSIPRWNRLPVIAPPTFDAAGAPDKARHSRAAAYGAA